VTSHHGGDDVEFRILGPVGLWCHDGPVVVGGPKPRAVLAALLLAQARVTSRERLIDLVWGDEPPECASDIVRQYVSALRRALRRCGRQDILVTHSGGYALRAHPAELDLTVFQALAAHGRQAAQAGRWAQAAADFRKALALWRGRALDGSSLAGGPVAVHLEEQRAQVLDERIEADLVQGAHAALTPELTRLLDDNPLNERLRGRLMVVLYRLGRRADALATYREGRTLLRTTLGVNPGPELQALRDAILRGDANMPGTPAAGPQAVHLTTLSRPAHVAPRQLPSDTADLTGFEQQTAEAVDQLLQAVQGTAVPMMVISGPGGVGKTTLAVHIAHRLRRDFPDGQLYVHLRGGTAQPAPVGEMLGRFLLALSVPASTMPSTVEERSEQFRTTVAGRRILVVLDDAASAAQIRPLLPGEAPCAVIITCRARLGDLAGATSIDLDMLEPAHAVALLGRIAGPTRVGAAPDAAERIVELCGRLPLAIRIAGARLASRPDRSVAWLANRLGHERNRLTELRTGGLEVRGSLATSYLSLSEPERTAFRALACLDGDFPGWVAGPLLDVRPVEVEAAVDGLVRARLLDIAGVDALGQPRYRFHDLVRLYGRELAESTDPIERRTAAVTRLAGAWLELAHTAGTRLPYSPPVAACRCAPRP
jgi:DNA-binding SARP family transcriptional activator